MTRRKRRKKHERPPHSGRCTQCGFRVRGAHHNDGDHHKKKMGARFWKGTA